EANHEGPSTIATTRIRERRRFKIIFRWRSVHRKCTVHPQLLHIILFSRGPTSFTRAGAPTPGRQSSWLPLADAFALERTSSRVPRLCLTGIGDRRLTESHQRTTLETS